MQCPSCNDVTLVMSERQGIEIDYCPQCRGVWLDRGELDKILERNAAASPPPPQGYAEDPRRHESGMRRDHHPDKSYGGKHYKKRNFLSDLLDF